MTKEKEIIKELGRMGAKEERWEEWASQMSGRPYGEQILWDHFVRAKYLDRKRPGSLGDLDRFGIINYSAYPGELLLRQAKEKGYIRAVNLVASISRCVANESNRNSERWVGALDKKLGKFGERLQVGEVADKEEFGNWTTRTLAQTGSLGFVVAAHGTSDEGNICVKIGSGEQGLMGHKEIRAWLMKVKEVYANGFVNLRCCLGGFILGVAMRGESIDGYRLEGPTGQFKETKDAVYRNTKKEIRIRSEYLGETINSRNFEVGE